MNLTGLAPRPKTGKPIKDLKHLARVAQLPCVICYTYGLQQVSPTQVHHCCHDRFGTLRESDRATIPLCEGHHQGLRDTSKIAIHREKQAWRDRYGPDYAYLPWVKAQLDEMEIGF